MKRSQALLGFVIVALIAGGVTAAAVRQDDGSDGTRAAPTTAPTPSSPSTVTTGPPPAGDADATHTPNSPTIEGAPAAAVAELQRLGRQVSEIRGLAWLKPLKVNLASNAEMTRRLKELTDVEIEKARDEIAGDEASLKMLKLIPSRTDYLETYQDLLEGAVLGFYDDDAKDLYVGTTSGRLDPAAKATMAHEMTHALTDQHYDYGPLTDSLDAQNKTEETAGLIALLEGDAELVRGLWMEEHLSSRERFEADFGGGGGDPSALADAPPYILDALFFPYSEGAEFVGRLHGAGGFKAIDAAYRDPPTSTEQIFHPDLYISQRQGWTPPQFPDLAAATGCRGVDTGTLGEFDMRHLLDASLSTARAQRAAQGWNGDRFALVTCDTKRGLADRWRTDPGVDPALLAGALATWAKGWSGSPSDPDAEGRFSGPSGSGRITRTGDTIDLVIADDLPTAQRLEQALG